MDRNDRSPPTRDNCLAEERRWQLRRLTVRRRRERCWDLARETIRRQTIHQFEQARVVDRNPDEQRGDR
jgi:hypothetical protein